MGLIFDRKIATTYESWYDSPQGRAIDKSIEQMVLSLIDPAPGERVLDIGCGAGNHLLTLSKLGLDVSGLDASPYMINKAGKRLGHRCTLRTGMAEDLPFEDNEFDFAVLINTLEFIDNPLQALREAGRVANKKVFMGVINSLSWLGLTKRIKGYSGDPLFGRTRFYNLWQLKSLIRMAYGHVPLSWSCIKIRPSFMEEMKPFGKDLLKWRNSPFGSFIGISATLAYRIKTDNLPLSIKLKRASQSIIGAKAFKRCHKEMNDCRGVSGNDERGVPV